MSNISVTSSKQEKSVAELTLELEALRTLNSSLRSYYEHIRNFKRNLATFDDNYTQLAKVNEKWLDTVNTLKSLDKA